MADDSVALWSEQDRRDLFEQTAVQRGLTAVIVEKDYWVCWTLGLLFNGPLGKNVVFKGGTSLSKVCLLYTSPSPRDRQKSRMPSSA